MLPDVQNNFQKKSRSDIVFQISLLFFCFHFYCNLICRIYNQKQILTYIVNERGDTDNERRFYLIIFYLDFLIIILLKT